MSTTEGTTMTIKVGDFVQHVDGRRGRVIAVIDGAATVYVANPRGEALLPLKDLTKLAKR